MWHHVTDTLKDAPSFVKGHALAGVAEKARVRDSIDLCYALHHQRMLEKEVGASGGPKRNAAGFFDIDCVLDTSQDMSRKPWAQRVRSMCSGSAFCYFPRDRMIVPREHLALLGFGQVCTTSLSHAQLRELSGEAMACPSVGLCLLTLATCLVDKSLWEV